MEILCCQKVDASEYVPDSTCEIYAIHVLIDNVEERAIDMIDTISSNSWITKLSAVDIASFSARARRTVEKLVKDIFRKVSSPISDEFGEYMVSLSAQDALETTLKHKKVPLADVFKERLTGNSGFDFHTESHSNMIAFGEAKYSGRINPYPDALVQIFGFITDGKDMMELTDLSKIVSGGAVDNALIGNKAYIAAFSINSNKPEKIFINVFKSDYIKPLLSYPELYLIGVEVYDTSACK